MECLPTCFPQFFTTNCSRVLNMFGKRNEPEDKHWCARTPFLCKQIDDSFNQNEGKIGGSVKVSAPLSVKISFVSRGKGL